MFVGRLSARKQTCAVLLYVFFVFRAQLAEARFILSEGIDTVAGSEESVTVKLANVTANRIRRDAVGGLPESLTFDLYLDEGFTTLSLRHNHDIDVNRRVYVMENGNIVPLQVPSLQEIAFFQDINSGAAVGVTCWRNTESVCDYQLEGILSKGGNSYLIFPGQKELHQQRNSTYSEYPHIIKKINESAVFSNDFIPKDDKSSPRLIRREKRDTGTTQTSYKVELYMVTDSSVYRFWYDKQSIGTDTEKRGLTLDAIRQYYAFLINAVDMRYKNINETDLSINVLFNGLLILETGEDSPWTDGIATSNPSDPNRQLVNAYSSLYSFTTWAQGRNDTLQSDHVMLFTAFDLERNGSPNNLGLAFRGTICTPLGTSVVENNFSVRGVLTASHELGHSLGAKHDGSENGNECSSDDNFIMATSVARPDEDNAQNPWHFSSCSVDYFRNLTKELDEAGHNCLVEERSDLDPTELTPLLQTHPGQFYGLDTQCSLAVGNGSFALRWYLNETTISDLCGDLSCSIPANRTRRRRITAATGSSCGDRKWCINGACIADHNAPPKLESCFLGDQPGEIVDGLTCAELKSSRPDRCYRDDVYRRCCASCNSTRTGIFDCAFGDRTPACASLSNKNCYAGQNGFVCCQTCDAYRTNITDCEFGDRRPACASLSNDQCYAGQNAFLCCQTCDAYRTNITDCEFGDRASNCGLISSASCYEELNNGRVCCQTCESYRTNIPGCEFGDKRAQCQSDSCESNQEYREQCCETCYVPPTNGTTQSTTSTRHPSSASTDQHLTSTPQPETSTPLRVTSTPRPISSSPKTITSGPLPTTSSPHPVSSDFPSETSSHLPTTSTAQSRSRPTTSGLTVTNESVTSTLRPATPTHDVPGGKYVMTLPQCNIVR